MKTITVVLALVTLAACGTTGATRKPTDTEPCPSGDCATDAPSRTSYRKVERDPNASSDPDESPIDLTGFEPFDPTVPDARVPDDEVQKLLGDADVDSDDVAALFRGDFASRSGDELAVLGPDSLEVRSLDGERIARRDLGSVDVETARAVRMVDERLELALRRRAADDAAEEVVLLRVIGSAVAEVFVHRLEEQGELHFVRRGEEKAIQIDDGDAEPATYLWNHWEGVFRIPRPAPTAPRR